MERVWLPFFPLEAIFAAAGVALLLAITAYLRTRHNRNRVAVLLVLVRSLAILLIAICLAGPARLPPAAPSRQNPILEIWLDTSGSMKVEDMDSQSRFAFAQSRWLSPEVLDRLGRETTLRAFAFDEHVRDLPSDAAGRAASVADGSTTRIVRSLGRGLAERPVDYGAARAVLLLSDGIDSHNDHPAPIIAAARARRIPIHTVALGGPRLEQDLSLLARPLQNILIAGEPGRIQVQVFQSNAGRRQVTLHIDDGIEPRVETLQFQGEPYLTVDIPVRHDTPGTYPYALRVDPLPREVEVRNNHQTVYLEVSPKRFRVLLVEGEPGWDTKYIAQALRNDPRMELLQVSQLSATRRETIATRIDTAEAAFPDTLAALGAYDAIILGRAPQRVAGAAWLELLRPFVEAQGGGLLWARGPPEAIGLPAVGELAALSPLLDPGEILTDVRLQPTSAGRLLPAFVWGELGAPEAVIQQLPPMQRGIVGRARAGAEIWAAFPNEPTPAPALLTMPLGSGRVMLLAGEGLWAWRLLDPQLADFDGVYDHFWTALVRQLVTSGDLQPGQDLGMQLSEVNVRMGTPIALSVSRRLGAPGGPLTCTIEHPDGRREPLALTEQNRSGTRLEAEITPTSEGPYLAVLEAPGARPPRIERRFNVFNVDAERLQTSARPEWLRMLARETGGEFLDPHHPERLPPILTRHQAAMATPVEPLLIWDRVGLMLAIAGLLGLEWILRKRKGWM